MEGIFCGGNYIYENGRCVVMNVSPTEIKYKEFEKIKEIEINYFINDIFLYILLILFVSIIILNYFYFIKKTNLEDEFIIAKKELNYLLNKNLHSSLLKQEINQLILSLENSWKNNKELYNNVSNKEIKEKLKIENKNILSKMKNIINKTIKIEESEDEKRILSILSNFNR